MSSLFSTLGRISVSVWIFGVITSWSAAETWLAAQGAPEPPINKSQNASIAAHTKWAKTDRREGTAKARRASLDRFEDIVDPERKLPAAERARRAESEKRAYFTRLSKKAARARMAKANAS